MSNYSSHHNEKRRKAHSSAAIKFKHKMGILFFRVVISALLIGGFWLGGIGLGAYFSIIENAPDLPPIVVTDGSFVTVILDSDGNEIDQFTGGERQIWATIDEMPQHLLDAFIALEDERFFSHNGVDFRGFARGIWSGISGGGFQGGSTITQQYIKNSLGITRNTIETKLQEQYMAMNFERQLIEELNGDVEAAKLHILELYLNIVYFGHRQYGIRAAASFFFGKELHELTLAESMVLASTVQMPYRRSPIRNPENNRARQVRGLERMHYPLGWITDEQLAEALEEDVFAHVTGFRQQAWEEWSFNSYFVDQLYLEVLRDLQVYQNMTAAEAENAITRGGLVIHSTKDSRIQRIVDEVYIYSDEMFLRAGFELEVTLYISVRNTLTDRESHFRRIGTVRNMDEVEPLLDRLRASVMGADDVILAERWYPVIQPQSGFVILDYRTGHVVAIAGGRGEKLTNRAFNRATLAQRQLGSVFKTLASFAPAIDLGVVTPATVVDDAPFRWHVWGNMYYEPGNWYAGFRGHRSIREAMAQSMNIVAVSTMVETGLDAAFEYLLNFGFSYGPGNSLRTQDRNNPAVALGGLTIGVTQLEAAAAFGAIANNGYLIPPTFYTRVYDRLGNLLLEHNPEPQQVLRSTSAYLLTNIMDVTMTSPSTSTGSRARLPNMPVSGKTGTSQDDRDLAFVGYTPYFVASIHLGHDQPRRLPAGSSTVHLDIWQTIMARVHEGKTRREFTRPPGIVEAQVCRVSGMLPRHDGLCGRDPTSGGTTRNAVVTEIFAAGTVPTETCTFHQPFNACTVSNLRSGPNCPGSTIRAFRSFPAGTYSGPTWIYDRGAWARIPAACHWCDPAPWQLPAYEPAPTPPPETHLPPYFHELWF